MIAPPEDPKLPAELQEVLNRLEAEFDCVLRGSVPVAESADMIICRRFIVHHPTRPAYKLKEHFNPEMYQSLADSNQDELLQQHLQILESFLRAELVQWSKRSMDMKTLPRMTHPEDPTGILNNFIEQLEQMMNESLSYPARPAWEGFLVGIENAMLRAIKQKDATPIDRVQIIAHFAIMTTASRKTDPPSLTSWIDWQLENRRIAIANADRD